MIAVRWCAFLVCLVSAAVLFFMDHSWASAVVAAVLILAFLVMLATFGVFRREVWFDGNPEYGEIDAELEAEERGR